jgi:hypothetical protein
VGVLRWQRLEDNKRRGIMGDKETALMRSRFLLDFIGERKITLGKFVVNSRRLTENWKAD